MNKTLAYTRPASRAFDGLPQSRQDEIVQALYLYGLTGHGDVKKLTGRPGLRIRVGSFRVVFEETESGLVILDVGDRRDIYR